MYIDPIFQSVFNYILRLADLGNPLVITAILFKDGGWVVVLLVMLWGLKEIWLYWRQVLYATAQEYVLLAIDVPKENEQGPKAVENIFAHVAGTYKNPCFYEKYLDGWLQPKFSFELISIGGYVQFLVHAPKKFRDLVEAAIYAQYPDTEITEVEDYTTGVPTQFPDESYELWGTEYTLYNKDYYPIKTHPSFEYGLTQEFKDPMASTLEMMSKISSDENIWLQLVITPIGSEWLKEGQRIVKKLIGAKVPEVGMAGLAKVGQFGQKIGSELWDIITASLRGAGQPEKPKKDELRSQMLYLSPGERTTVEAIESKLSKIAFDTKFRMIYWGKKEVFSRSRGAYGMAGAIKQFNTLDLNGFKSHSKTKSTVDYFRKRREPGRKKRIVLAYKYRSNWRGWAHHILNIEELATLWHFPVLEVKAPFLKKTEAKRMEPPFALPVESFPIAKAPKIEETPFRPERQEEPQGTKIEETALDATFKIPEEADGALKNQKSMGASLPAQAPENLPVV